MCKPKFINQSKRWKEKEYLVLILMYLTGILLYYRNKEVTELRLTFPSLKKLVLNNNKSFIQQWFLNNPFGIILCKLRSKESILNKLDYYTGYYPIVKQTFIGYKTKENKDATTKFKYISKLLLDDHSCTDILKLEVLAQKLHNSYMQNTIFGHAYSNLADLYIKKVISLEDYYNITKTIDNLFK